MEFQSSLRNAGRALADGAAIDAPRIVRVAAIMAAFAALNITLITVFSSGGLDYQGRPLGTDFSNVWSAGAMVNEGRAAEAYQPPLQNAKQAEIFGRTDVPFYAWHYPPFFLVAAALLALAPYVAAWFIWMAATLPLYLASVWKILPHRIALIAALGFPAVLVNFLHGQNGFLTAALLGGGLALLNRKQALAGVLIGLLAYKPQFGVLIPLALAAGGYWRAFVAAAATVIALAAFSTAIFGVEIWQAFFESRHYTKGTILEAGATGWEKIQSVFSALRMWGAPVWLAYAAQAGAALALGACVIAVWRSGVDFGLKAATLIVASLLATPYSLDYDLMALGPAIAFFAAYGLREGFHPYEKSLLALAWLCPIAARPAAEFLMVPLGLAATTLFFLAIMRRAGIGLDVRRAAKPVAPA